MANILGYDSMYRIEHMRSTDAMQFSSDVVTEGKIDGIRIVTDEPGLDVGGRVAHGLSVGDGIPEYLAGCL